MRTPQRLAWWKVNPLVPPPAKIVMPVPNVRDIMNIVENKETSIKTPRLNHNPQRSGLGDNLFDFESRTV